ncbi:enoyl-ACP reductase FabI, partial [Stomatohabitans albus]
MPQLLAGRRVLVTGVLNEDSIAFAVAKNAQLMGADVILTGAGRAKRLTELTAKRLPEQAPVLEMDVTNDEQIEATVADVDARWGRLDGLVHAIAFGPSTTIGGEFVGVPFEDVSKAIHISTWSFARLGEAFRDLLRASDAASYVGLTFDASIAWPGYNWMGVCKAGLESANRYVARDFGPDGIRVNLVSAGPLRTVAAKSVGGFDALQQHFVARAPMHWDLKDPDPTGKVVCSLLSPMMPCVTGEIV